VSSQRWRERAAGIAATGAVAAMAGVLFTVLCAAGTVGLALVGTGGVVWSSRLEWTRPYLLALAGILLAISFVLGYRRCGRASRGIRALLWTAALLTLVPPLAVAWAFLG